MPKCEAELENTTFSNQNFIETPVKMNIAIAIVIIILLKIHTRIHNILQIDCELGAKRVQTFCPKRIFYVGIPIAFNKTLPNNIARRIAQMSDTFCQI